MHEMIDYIVSIVGSLGYTGIFVMMVLESSFFPFPSEVAMIPAGYLSSTWEMSFPLALLIWTFWALVWATINYILGYKLGWPIIKWLIKKYGKYFLIKEEHYEKTEVYFQKHWVITTFLARFITVIRQLISLPAWVFKMNFAKFFFFTWLWAWGWNLALMSIWYIAWENKELIAEYTKELLFWGIFLIIVIWTIYYLVKKIVYENVSVWIAVNSENKVLLQERRWISKLWEKWASFGWKIEEWETSEQALERQIKEELNLEIKKYKSLGRKTYFFWEHKKIITINYFISFVDLNINKLEVLEWSWAKYFSLKELDSIWFVEKGKSLKKFKRVIKQELKLRKKSWK